MDLSTQGVRELGTFTTGAGMDSITVILSTTTVVGAIVGVMFHLKETTAMEITMVVVVEATVGLFVETRPRLLVLVKMVSWPNAINVIISVNKSCFLYQTMLGNCNGTPLLVNLRSV